jgi:hypothetical protein
MVASIVYTFESRVGSAARPLGLLGSALANSGNRAMNPSPRGFCVRAVFTAKARLWQDFIGVESCLNP